MKINRVQINNFRNFRHLDVELGEDAVIVGENKIGKTNFLYALRLILDPSLPDSARQLQQTDFWDGIKSLTKEHQISISIDITNFEDNEDIMAILADHIISPEPLTARLTYLFRPLHTLSGNPDSEADYEFIIFGGDNTENRVGHEVRRRIPLDVLSALRDAEGDLQVWRRSPLRPLLNKVVKEIDQEELYEVAQKVTDAQNEITSNEDISNLENSINKRLLEMIGSTHGMDVALGITSNDPYKLIRMIRLFIDKGERSINEASLGSSNILYLALKSLELERLVEEGSREHTFLGIEEPEAHLHPHLQRLVYRDFLRSRTHQVNRENNKEREHQSILLTTHSPHIVSVSPLRSIVLFRHSDDGSTEAESTVRLDLSHKEEKDLERYIDVTRGEILFAKGIIFVEGVAEEYLLPVFGDLIGCNFDELGITVCSIAGANFIPYIKLVGEKGLKIPYSVLTDLDPQGEEKNLGHTRVKRILKEVMDDEEYRQINNDEELLKSAPTYGIFLNNYTLETELLENNFIITCKTLKQLTSNKAMKERVQQRIEDPDSIDKLQFLKDVGNIGKGRFAQRLATNIIKSKRKSWCPQYIEGAIKYVAAQIR